MPSLIGAVLLYLLAGVHAELNSGARPATLPYALSRDPAPSRLVHDLPRRAPLNFPSSSLSVLCIGDSITVGVGDGYPNLEGYNNGYRLDLYNLLEAGGLNATFIGTQISGTDNPQPRNEGYGGQTIDVILANIQKNGILAQQPNLVLIHAGTNDNDWPQTSDNPTFLWADESTRLGHLIDFVLCQDPNAVVLVAKLIQNKYNQEQTNAFNAQIPGVVNDRFMQGFKIRTVDMSMIGGNELSDLLHPTAIGYNVMAERWYSAILGIPESWWATASSPMKRSLGDNATTCERNAISFTAAIGGNVVAPGFQVAGDSPNAAASPSQSTSFTPGWTDGGLIALGVGYAGSGVLFADINGDGLADYIWANYTQGSEGAIRAWLNGGHDVWYAVANGEPITWGEAGTSLVGFADLDGDGLQDYILVVGGQFRVWRNGGPIGQEWSWTPLPNAENELNYIFAGNAPQHWWADMTGDGRADMIVYDDGVLDIYFNQGPDGSGSGFRWTRCKGVAYATNDAFFADIDGDGRADYVAADADGGLHGWLNRFSGGCALNWAPIGSAGADTLSPGRGVPSSQVRLADYTGDGKADYLTVADANGAIHLYKNVGNASVPGTQDTTYADWADAIRLNDVDGDGQADYVFVDSTFGGIAAWLNEGQGAANTWLWNETNNGDEISLGFYGATREDIRLADLNANGRDDHIAVDPTTGSLRAYLNYGPSSTHVWNWVQVDGEFATGLSSDGAGVRLADIDGDGRADYIFLGPSGSPTIWLNQGSGNDFSVWNMIQANNVPTLAAEASRDDIQFADIDGDGLADYCWLNPYTGDLQVWFNIYDGQSAGWIDGGTVASGKGYSGTSIRLARIGTSGRADYVAIDETNGALTVWLNECSDINLNVTRAAQASTCGQPPFQPRSTTEGVVGIEPTVVSTAYNGQTVIMGSENAQFTMPAALTAPATFTAFDSETITWLPGGNTLDTTFTNTAGLTILQGSWGAQTTLPTGITTPLTVTETDRVVITYSPTPTSQAAAAAIDIEIFRPRSSKHSPHSAIATSHIQSVTILDSSSTSRASTFVTSAGGVDTSFSLSSSQQSIMHSTGALSTMKSTSLSSSHTSITSQATSVTSAAHQVDTTLTSKKSASRSKHASPSGSFRSIASRKLY